MNIIIDNLSLLQEVCLLRASHNSVKKHTDHCIGIRKIKNGTSDIEQIIFSIFFTYLYNEKFILHIFIYFTFLSVRLLYKLSTFLLTNGPSYLD